MSRTTYSRIACLCIALMFFSLSVIGGTNIHTKVKKGSNIKTSATIDLKEDFYDVLFDAPSHNPVEAWRSKNQIVTNRLLLKYIGANRDYYTDWTVKVEFDVYLYDLNDAAYFSMESGELEIDFTEYVNGGTSFFDDLAVWSTTGGHRMRVEITDVIVGGTDLSTSNDLTNDFLLEAQIEVDKNYFMDETVNLNPQFKTVGDDDISVLFYWDYLEGAEEYEFEWEFVNEEAGTTPLDFLDWQDASGITTSNTYYELNIPYEPGTLYYRVRGVGPYYSHRIDGQMFRGNWSTEGEPAGTDNIIIEEDEGFNYDDPLSSTDKMQNVRNWVYEAVYAEDGKRKEIISFFDGSGRNRQTVTINNTEQEAVLTETFYDYEGRPVVQSLPSPDKDGSGDLKFYEQFNLNGSTSVFSKVDFDQDVNFDESVANSQFNTLDGPGRYYSVNNQELGGFNAFIANAEGFPYTRTVYGRDGRVEAQSGPGLTHNIGNDHETRYYYASPFQESLDRLFGSEVGEADFYRLKMVEDANGQMSLSYEKIDGTVIATSLIGKPDEEDSDELLKVLDDYSEETMPIKFENDNIRYLTDRKLVIDRTFVVGSSATVYDFIYDAVPYEYMSELCDVSNKVDAPCQYLITIEVFDADDNMVHDFDPGAVVSPATTPPGYDPFTSTGFKLPYSATITNGVTYDGVDFSLSLLPPGTYRIVKTLSLDLTHMYTELIAFLDDSECGEETTPYDYPALWDPSLCQDCEDDLFVCCTTYCENLATSLGYDGTTNPTWAAYVAECKDEDHEDCDNATPTIESLGQEVEDCNKFEEIMALDMSPGGQYFDNDHLAANSNTDPAGWFHTYVLTDNHADWADMDFEDLQGNAITTYTDLRDNWQPGWATQAFTTAVDGKNALVEFHPEYCAMDWCEDLQESSDFNWELKQIETYSAAEALGYIDDGASDPEEVGWNLVDDAATNYDPVVDIGSGSGSVGDEFETRMLDLMEDYYPNCTTCTTTPVSMWEVAVLQVEGRIREFEDNSVSPSTTPYDDCVLNINNFPPDETSGTTCTTHIDGILIEDMIWQRFRDLYLTSKARILNDLKEDASWEDCPSLHDPNDPPDGYADHRSGSGTEEDMDDRAEGFLIRRFDLIDAIDDILDAPITEATIADIEELTDDGNGTTWGTSWERDYTLCERDARVLFDFSVGDGPNCDFVAWDRTAPADALDQSVWSFNCTRIEIAIVDKNDNVVQVLFDDVPETHNAYCWDGTSVDLDFGTSGFSSDPEDLGAYLSTHGANGKATIYAPDVSSNREQYNGYKLVVRCDAYGILATLGTFEGGTDEDCEEVAAPHCVCAELELLEEHYTVTLGSVDANCVSCSTDEWIAYKLDEALYSGVATIDKDDVADWRTNCTASAATNQEQYPVEPTEGWRDCPSCTTATALPTEMECPFDDTYSCGDDETTLLTYYESLDGDLKKQELANQWITEYVNTCFGVGGNKPDELSLQYEDPEQQWTLYYYDLAGNLIRTIPPEGVYPLTGTDITMVQNFRKGTGTATYPTHSPAHSGTEDYLVTSYQYNSYGNIVLQETPDGGETEFWYDRAGRLMASQDAEQRFESQTGDYKYSYTTYDEHSRITEVGEATDVVQLSSKADGTTYTNNNTYDILNDEDFPINADWEGTASHITLSQRTVTHYDDEQSNHPVTFDQEFTRGRVSAVLRDYDVYFYTAPGVYTVKDAAPKNTCFYSYDIHGNVSGLTHEFYHPQDGYFKFIKNVEYQYDLISGNVNEVAYQRDQGDQWLHRYNYDADNRITNVYTSTDGHIWDQDAKYFYYRHGPLARTEIGDKKVQGCDYGYTIHGWLKGINSDMVDPEYDMGKDGLEVLGANTAPYLNDGVQTEGLHYNFAQDAYGFSLGYYHNLTDDYYDYKRIGSTGNDFIAAVDDGSALYDIRSGTHNLYNGNIGHMVTTIPDADALALGNITMRQQAGQYRYDQLNRLVQATFIDGLNTSTNAWSTTSTLVNDYKVDLEYDRNGNITSLERYADGTPTGLMDDLAYDYTDGTGKLENNRLNSVTEGSGDPDNGNNNDITGTHNYSYDKEGNLTQDLAEDIEDIEWDAYGKISKITRKNTSTDVDLEFVYDGMGNRIIKIVKPRDGTSLSKQNEWTYHYYVRDAQGNILATYKREFEAILPDVTVSSPHLGVIHVGDDENSAAKMLSLRVNGQDITGGPVAGGATASETATNLAAAINTYTGGTRDYTATTDDEFVMLTGVGTIPGEELPLEITYLADDPSYQYNDDVQYLRIVPIAATSTTSSFTASKYYRKLYLDELMIYGSSRLGVNSRDELILNDELQIVKNSYLNGDLLEVYGILDRTVTNPVEGPVVTRTMGKKQYELSNHLGNVLAVVSDMKVPVEDGVTAGLTSHYTADILTVSDYYPFGMQMPGSAHSSGDYTFGFQGQEHDDEVAGPGNSVFFKYRVNDPRTGRFFSIDPLAASYPHNSPYAFSENRVIDGVELEGTEFKATRHWADQVSDRHRRKIEKAYDVSLKAKISYSELYTKMVPVMFCGYADEGTVEDCANTSVRGLVEFAYKYKLPIYLRADGTAEAKNNGKAARHDPTFSVYAKGDWDELARDIGTVQSIYWGANNLYNVKSGTFNDVGSFKDIKVGDVLAWKGPDRDGDGSADYWHIQTVVKFDPEHNNIEVVEGSLDHGEATPVRWKVYDGYDGDNPYSKVKDAFGNTNSKKATVRVKRWNFDNIDKNGEVEGN